MIGWAAYFELENEQYKKEEQQVQLDTLELLMM
jgi:hypothetical protein